MRSVPRVLVLALLLIVAATGCSRVYRAGDEVAPGVVFLGRREVSLKIDRDRIEVGRDTGRFSKVRFEVDDAPIAVYNVRIEFGNGEVYSPDTRLVFGEGGWSREIELPGDHRFIRDVTFLYESVGRPGRGRAVVRVYGLR